MSKFIPLPDGQQVIVDDQDYDFLTQWKWRFHARYVMRSMRKGDSGSVLMQRVIMQPADDQIVDHINHDTLDNRRANLRICTKTQNGHNRRPNQRGSSRFKGVVWQKVAQKWEAQIDRGGVPRDKVYLGLFVDEIEAARAYDAAAKLYHGEFAYLNFPED